MDIEIQTVQVEMQPEWRALIEDRLARLGTRYPELIRVHVTLRHGRHHRLGTEEVDIVANCAGATLRAAKEEERMRDAVHAALDALERELVAHHETRRHFGKAPGARPAGVVATGSTAIAAIRSLRARGVGRVVLAAPVASSRAAGALRGMVDEMEAGDAVA